MEIKEKLPASVRFEFFGITGKTYTIERSLDFKTWTRIPFSIAVPATGELSHTAAGVGILSAFTVPAGGTGKEFFRLNVR
jgi:hypothetical protein